MIRLSQMKKKNKDESILFAPAHLIKKDLFKTGIISLIFFIIIFALWFFTQGNLQNLPKKLPFI